MSSLPTYDSTKVSSLSLTPSQKGTESGITSAWSDEDFPLGLGLLSVAGISFDFSVNNDSERGLALAPRRPFTAATDDLAGTGETATTWTLTLSTNITLTGFYLPLKLHAVTAPNPDAWSGTTNTPTLNRDTLDTAYLIENIQSDSSTWVLNGSTYDLVWNFDFHTHYTEATAGAQVLRPMFNAVNSPLWNGLIQFILHTEALGGFNVTAATFAGNVHRWHTGATDQPLKRRGRVVHDYITGQPYLSDEAVPDGYRKGIMVHPDNYDPPDPTEESPWTPPPGEGEIDDEIVNTEG